LRTALFQHQTFCRDCRFNAGNMNSERKRCFSDSNMSYPCSLLLTGNVVSRINSGFTVSSELFSPRLRCREWIFMQQTRLLHSPLRGCTNLFAMFPLPDSSQWLTDTHSFAWLFLVLGNIISLGGSIPGWTPCL
jgi:hypothetical protein